MQLMFIPRLDALKYAALYGPLRALKLARVAWAVTECDTATCSRNCISNGFKRSTIKHDGASGRVHIDVLHTHTPLYPYRKFYPSESFPRVHTAAALASVPKEEAIRLSTASQGE